MTLVLMVMLVAVAWAQEPSPCSPNPCGENTRCQVVSTMQTSVFINHNIRKNCLLTHSPCTKLYSRFYKLHQSQQWNYFAYLQRYSLTSFVSKRLFWTLWKGHLSMSRLLTTCWQAVLVRSSPVISCECLPGHKYPVGGDQGDGCVPVNIGEACLYILFWLSHLPTSEVSLSWSWCHVSSCCSYYIFHLL